MNHLRRTISALMLTLTSCLAPWAQASPPTAAIGRWGVDTAGLSTTIRPGDDFYRYVNAGWLKTAAAPAGLPAIDSFVEVYLSTEKRVAGIVAQAGETAGAPGSPEQMISDFHRSHANRERRNALGITPIASTLAIIAGTTDKRELARIMAYPWIEGFFPTGPMSDAAVPTRQIAALGVGGLTMPSRDYYLTDAEPYIGHRKALLDYIAASFRRAGFADADARASKVLALETAIAKRHWSVEQRRDVVRMNHVMTPGELKKYAPGFPWNAFLAELKYDK